MHINPNMAAFFDSFKHEGLTFDDVSLVTRYSDFLPDQADISTRLTKRIKLNTPYVSAAMDTVTESKMAIAMAMNGGIGIIHKNLDIESQRKQVRVVKHYLNGLIHDPVVFKDEEYLDAIEAAKDQRGYNFSGFPIVNIDGKLVGILTSTDIRFAKKHHVKVRDVMTTDVVTAADGTTLKEAYDLMMKNKIGKLPLVKDGKLTGLYSFTDVQTLIEKAKPLYNRDEKYRLRVGAAVGPADHERAEALAKAEVDVIVVDSAHGHSKGIIDMVVWLKKHLPEIDVIAGNVGTGEGALALRDAGVDGIKIGIGPGSICTTRVVCGVGVPQITAIHECAAALQGSVPLIADGGIKQSGDVPKALAAGADTVMLGGVLARTEESPGEKIIHEGRQYVVYRGMGSLEAMKAAKGSRQRYGQDNTNVAELVPQGVEGIVPYSGSVEKVMTQYGGGLRASLGYCGCPTIPELQKKARFVRVSLAGLSEAHPHDIKIIKEAPNYKT